MAKIEIEYNKTASRVDVWIDGHYLHQVHSQEVWNHSPDGFNVGYGGSGPAQLALAILLKFTDEDTAVRLHQTFKWDLVAKWEAGRTYQIDVPAWIEIQKKKREYI